MNTHVDEEAVERWCRKFSDPGCVTFLENFFCSCTHLTIDANIINYINDIRTHKRIDPKWKEYEPLLLHAFFDVTGEHGYLN